MEILDRYIDQLLEKSTDLEYRKNPAGGKTFLELY